MSFWSYNVVVEEAGVVQSQAVGGLLGLKRSNNSLRHGRQTLSRRRTWRATGLSCRWGAKFVQACGSDCWLM